MTEVRRGSGVRRLAVVAVLALLLGVAGPIARLKAESPASSSVVKVDMPGLTSAENNVAFAFDGKYAVVAPFAPSSYDDTATPDNHYLYLVDTQNSHNVIRCDLDDPVTGASRIYPTHLVVSSGNVAFVRATRIDQSSQQPQEGISYAQMVSDKEGGILFQNVEFLPINPVGKAEPSLMPTSFGVSNGGQFVCYTDGAQLFVVDLTLGNTYPVPIVTDYKPLASADDSISDYYEITSVAVDPTNVISVTVNGRRNGINFSELYFYYLHETGKHAGTIDSQALPIKSDQDLPPGVGITPGSKPAISPDGKLGYFATDDGTLWSVVLSGSANLKLNKLGTYASVSTQGATTAPGPRIVEFDSTGKRISIVRQGVVIEVRRPTFGKHRGGVRRPTFVKLTEPPGLTVVHLNAQGEVADAQETKYFGNGVETISNTALTEDGSAYFAATYGVSIGTLMQIDKAGIPSWYEDAVPGIKRIVPADASTIVGMQDFGVDLESKQQGIISPGALVFMSLRQATDAAVSAKAAIRRPCNVNH